MEMEHGVYHALLRLGFEMYISPILVLAITQSTSNQSNSFSRRRATNQKPFKMKDILS